MSTETTNLEVGTGSSESNDLGAGEGARPDISLIKRGVADSYDIGAATVRITAICLRVTISEHRDTRIWDLRYAPFQVSCWDMIF